MGEGEGERGREDEVTEVENRVLGARIMFALLKWLLDKSCQCYCSIQLSIVLERF